MTFISERAGVVFRFGKRYPVLASAAAAAAAFLLWLVLPPGPPFREDCSRVAYDVRGRLLCARLAADGQYRFPLLHDSLPAKYIAAVTTCEDRNFFRHPGVDPVALVKAAVINLRKKKRVRGGSTITMQVVRLSHPENRTYINKVIECLTALKLSLHFSKADILRLYAAHVPMGGNTVGLDAASWRYFGKPLSKITWAEAALFTVLPNNPSMINMGRKRGLLVAKRNRALGSLLQKRLLDTLSFAAACLEELPGAVNRIPFETPHFVNAAFAACSGPVVKTTLDLPVQKRVEEIIGRCSSICRPQGIYNCAALVLNTQSGAVAAYVGSEDYDDTLHQGRVDGVTANRSTGSLLKPFLVAKILDRGPYIMESMVQDVPTFYGSFCPENATKDFEGLVSMREMLVQSLNVPSVRMLYWYGLNDFYGDLKNCSFSGLFRPAAGYGLTLIIGGAEGNLWDLTRFFACLGNGGIMKPSHLLADPVSVQKAERDTVRFCSPGAAWLVLNTLSQLRRPGAEYYWQLFTNQVPVAWKTGTSYGQKDAWSIGVNAEWTIGVWVGNFSGEGNAALGGAQTAGPIMFQLFGALSDRTRKLWFVKPEYDLRKIAVCKKSGLPATDACTDTIAALQPLEAYKTGTCTFHRRVLLDRKRGFSVCSKCWSGLDTVWKSMTIYPPSVRAVLAQKGFKTDTLPLHNPACPVGGQRGSVEIVYPPKDISIIVPRNLQGEFEKIVFKAATLRPSGRLFWYLDNVFIAETIGEHSVAVDLKAGNHRLCVQDESGTAETVRFQAFRKL